MRANVSEFAVKPSGNIQTRGDRAGHIRNLFARGHTLAEIAEIVFNAKTPGELEVLKEDEARRKAELKQANLSYALETPYRLALGKKKTFINEIAKVLGIKHDESVGEIQ